MFKPTKRGRVVPSACWSGRWGSCARPHADHDRWREFYEKNKHRTQGDWLQLAVARHSVDVLLLHQRWAEAERALNDLIGVVEKGTDAHRTLVKSLASALNGLGRPGEAIDMLCKLVLGSPNPSTEDTLSTLYVCAQLARSSSIEVPAELRDVFIAASLEYGLAGVTDGESGSLLTAIESAHQQRLEAQDRYVEMLEGLTAKDPSARREHLRHYAESEPVRFFRDMALRSAREDNQGRE